VSLVKCGRIGCRHHVRQGLVRDRVGAASGLADGVYCWRCRRGQRVSSSPSEPAAAKLVVPESILLQLRHSPKLCTLLERAYTDAAWLGIEHGSRISDGMHARRLQALGLGEIVRRPVRGGSRKVNHFRLTELGWSAYEGL
jgi:hypothetical protein